MNSSNEAFAYLNARYIDCSQFSSEMSNVWGNYYLLKKNTLSSVVARENTAQQSVNAVNTDLNNNVDPLVTGTISGLYGSSESILNTQTGLLGGLNCGVIG